ncbi:MAG: hypothetical protein CUN55_14520 [Phototrophicales bacterium]|nr:MAG: hypothetical protein CUN55_14520 [Phototrophicales bacterium]
MKVLVAEDNFANREIISETLRAVGYEAIIVTEGTAAIEAVQKHSPDLVILDVNMPGMDGFEVCAAIKKNPLTTQIPVIMLTAQTDIKSRVRGLGLGADDYIAKPFSPKELLARIDARLRIKAETDTLREQRQALRRIFERFVAPEIVNALMHNPESAQLGGAIREITVLFADLEGFTSLSEHTQPTTLLNVLNAYHGLVIQKIKLYGGTVDKLLGDGVMAIYNAPIELSDHPKRAVVSAVDIHRSLPAFYDTLAPEFHLKINFGIHTGFAIVGNVGTHDVMDYTAVGDTVNLASRLQAMSHGNVITISESTYERVKEWVHARYNGPQDIRGRESKVNTYQVIDATGLSTLEL